jgi:hypothetical protein
MLYYFYQVQVRPTRQSALGRKMPEVNGAFVNCVVRAETEKAADKGLRDALRADGYTYLEREKVVAIDGTDGEGVPELEAILARLGPWQGDVGYGDFHCYE